MIRVHIQQKLESSPFGGSHQFQSALKKEFRHKGFYEKNVANADIVLISAYHNIFKTLFLKLIHPQKLVFNRIDGPISLYNEVPWEVRDLIVVLVSNFFADAIIFQSHWSKNKNEMLYCFNSKYKQVIHNAPNDKIYVSTRHKQLKISKKVKIIAISWSSNWKKGFETYKWLDDNLDFSKFDLIFVGCSPINFNNILHIPPLKSEQLSKIINDADIYLTASKNDPCSNSLLEAISCGLPVIALNSGGHPELIPNNELLFNKVDELPDLFSKVIDNYQKFANRKLSQNLSEVSQQYIQFFQDVFSDIKTNQYHPKQMTILNVVRFLIELSSIIIHKYKHKMLKK